MKGDNWIETESGELRKWSSPSDVEKQAQNTLAKLKNERDWSAPRTCIIVCQNCKNQGTDTKFFTKKSLLQLENYIDEANKNITDSMDLIDENTATEEEIIKKLTKAVEILNYLSPKEREY